MYGVSLGTIRRDWVGMAVPSSAPAGAGLLELYRFHGFRSPAATSTRGYIPWPLSGPEERQTHLPLDRYLR